MKSVYPYKVTAIYCLIIAVLNIVTWTFLILSGRAEPTETEILSYIFHWFSEFMTILFLLIAGVQLLLKNANCRNLMFLSLGFLIMAIGGAFIHYLFYFEMMFFVFSSIITGITILFIIINYRSLKDFILITLGVSVYAFLNILGHAIEEVNLSLMSMSAPALLFIIILIVSLWNKDIGFKYQKRPGNG